MRLGVSPEELWGAFCGRCRRTVAEGLSREQVEAVWVRHLDEVHQEVNYS